MSIKIAWMYPDTLFLHGERGNILALSKVAGDLGVEAEIEKIDFETDNFDPSKYDVLFFGPGEISSFPAIIEDMDRYLDKLIEFIYSGSPLVVTGTTVAMFGEKILRTDGSEIEGLSVIPVKSREREYVYGDDEQITAVYNGRKMDVIGNQIQMINVYFTENANFGKFGNVIYGMGNNGKDGIEGVLHNNSIFTNMLGPVLVHNPWLTAEIIKVAAGKRAIQLDPSGLNTEMEEMSLQGKKEYIANKPKPEHPGL